MRARTAADRSAGPAVTVAMFSCDRAMQLDAVLRSLTQHCSDAELLDLHVLFKASSEQAQRQYAVVREDWEDVLRLSFHQERDFRKDLLSILDIADDDAWRSSTIGRRALRRAHRTLGRVPKERVPWNHVLFLVDDNVFVRPFAIRTVTQALDAERRALGFSLRLGGNLTENYMRSRPQRLPDLFPVGDGVSVYEWQHGEFDFGYPLEVSSSVYRSEPIAWLLSAMTFSSPNSLEAVLARTVTEYKLARRWPRLLCFERSVTFCNAVNKIQTVYPDNRSGESEANSVPMLADLFDAGFRIDTRALQGFEPHSCHDEVAFRFVRSQPGGAAPAALTGRAIEEKA